MFYACTNKKKKKKKKKHAFATVPKSIRQIEIHSTRIYDRSLP